MRTWLLTIALFFACAAPGHAYIYWTDGTAGTIGRANHDGPGVDPNFITGATSPRGIAVNEDHIYWANARTIARADLDGSDVNQAFITAAARGVAVDGSYLYWTTANGIGRASLDGSPVNHAFITGETAPFGVAVNDVGVYWSNANGAIRRANLDGSGTTTLKSDALAGGLAVDDSRLAWASPSALFVGALTLTDPITSFPAAAPRSVEIGGSWLYWTEDGRIGRTDRTNFIPADDPRMLAVDGGQSGTASPSATTLSFGSDTVGTLGVGRTLTVTNTGPGELAIGSVQITGPQLDDFLLGPDTCSSARLTVDATCTVGVVFLPDAIGDRTATLTIASNDLTSPLQIALHGTGEDPSPPGSFDDDFGFDDEFEDDDEELEDTADRPRLVTCRIVEVRVEGRRVERRRCRNRRLRGTPNFATAGAAHATLTRGKTIYGTGTVRRSRVVLDLHRRVEPGRYRLTLRSGGDIIRRARIRILKDR